MNIEGLTLPTGWSQFFHHLPQFFHQASVIAVFAIELVVPCLIVFPRRIRTWSSLLLILFQLLIIASGHFGFLNLLTIVLCLTLIDDQSLPKALQRRFPPEKETILEEAPLAIDWIRIFIALIFLFVGGIQIAASSGLYNLQKPLTSKEPPAWVPYYSILQRYHMVNPYGLFSAMATERSEIIIEGSRDGITWLPYTFKYKPGALDTPPQWVTLHMPRLDWKLWFAALQVQATGYYPSWMLHFLQALARNQEPVLDLLAQNPFPNEPPQFLKIALYDYQFSIPEAFGNNVELWQRQLLPEYTMILPTEKWIQD